MLTGCLGHVILTPEINVEEVATVMSSAERIAEIVQNKSGVDQGGTWLDSDGIVSGCQDVLREAVEDERKAISAAMCRDCARGDVPTHNANVNHYYHDLGDGEEIGCSASVVHHRSRNAS